MKSLMTSLSLLAVMFIFFPLSRDAGIIGANSNRSGLTFISQVETGPKINIYHSRTYDFSNIQIWESSGAAVGIQNKGTTDLTVHSISDPGLPFELTSLPTLPMVLSPGDFENFDVTFSPTSPGAFSGKISIGSDDPDDPTVDIWLMGNRQEEKDIPPSDKKTPQEVFQIFRDESRAFAEKLEKGEVYKGTFIHPLMGGKMTRELKGMVDGKWTSIEQMPNGGKMVCKFSDERRRGMAQYYKDTAKAFAKGSKMSFSSKSKFGSSGNETKSTTKIDGKEIRNILQEMLDSGECVVLGYDAASLEKRKIADAKAFYYSASQRARRKGTDPAPKVNSQQNFEAIMTQDQKLYFNIVKVVKGHVFIQSDSPDDFDVGTIYEIVRGHEANYVEIGRAKVALKKGSTIALQVIQSSGSIQISDKIKYNK